MPYCFIICDNSKLYHVVLLYVITTTCIFAALCKILCHIYIHSIYSIVKYGIIMVSCKTLMQNAYTLHPIVIDTHMNFQYRAQLSFIYLMNQKGIRSLQVTMNLVHFEFLSSRSLLNPKQEC